MKLNKLLTSTACVLTLAGGAYAATFTSADVGTPTLAGSSTVNGDGTISIKGSGDDIWNTTDSFQYYYTSVQGLVWDAVVRVRSLDAPVSDWAKCELMVREDDGTGKPSGPDPFIANMTTAATLTSGGAAQNLMSPQIRTARSGSADQVAQNPTIRPTFPNTWLKVTRRGSVFSLWYGTDGVAWTLMQPIDTAVAGQTVGTDNSTTFGTPWKNPILVGIAVTAHDNTALATATISDLSIGPGKLPTVLKGATDGVKDISVTAGSTTPVVSFTATNDAVGFPTLYQWYKNDQPVTNAASSSFAFLASSGDNGAKIYCQAYLDPLINSNNVAAVYSSTGTVTVVAGTVYTSGLKREVFMGATRAQVESGSAGQPTYVEVFPSFEMPANNSVNNFAERVSGWFIAPVTTNYTFFVCSDDDSDLFLSTDDTPAHKQLVAQESVWSNPDEWVTTSGTSSTDQKRSDRFSPDQLTTPFAAGIPMVAGHRYYIEGVHHQGGGGVNFGATYSFWTGGSDTDPTNGAPSMLQATNGNIAFITGPSTTLTITKDPQSELIYDVQTAFFSVETASDSELQPYFQWYRDGQPIANATGTSYSFVASAKTDNGAKFFVTANSEIGGLWATSKVATLTVESAIFEAGFVKVEKAPAAEPSEAQIQARDIGTVTQVYANSAFAAGAPGNADGDNYGKRLSGFFIPPSSGNYSFITCSDDMSALFLSTDDTPAKAVWIAYETAWSNPLEWASGSGGSSAAQKHSDTFVNPTTSVAPYPNGVPLVGGTKYYIEVDQREGGGGDNVEVTYYKTGTTPPADQTASALTGSVVGSYVPRCTYVAFTNQPANATVNSLQTATFTAGGITDSTIPINPTGTGPTIMTNFLVFQWTKNGVDIPGATSAVYTTPPEGPWDNNAQIACKMRALGFADTAGTPAWSNSQTAVLTVNADTTPPALVYAGYYNFTNVAGEGQSLVSVRFNKLMDPATLAVASHYTIPGLTVVSVTVNSNNYSAVQLVVTGTPSFPLSLTLNGITDGWGTAPAVLTTSVGKSALISQDIGTAIALGGTADDPVFPSKMYMDGTNAYTIMAQGSDIWGQHDGCNFAYEVRSGDFDVAVRVKSVTHTSQWAKAGLMAREDLAADSRNWNIVNDPLASDGIAAPDGSGNGANIVECNWRTNGVFTGAESQAWNIIPQTNSPAYPNAWLRMKRTGTIITAMLGNNGRDWITLGAYDVSTNLDNPVLPNTLYVGICTTAHNNDSPTTTNPLYWNTVHYADYMSVYVPTQPPNNPTLTLGQQAGVWKITYTGTLQSSATIDGTFTDVTGASSPYTVPTTSGTMRFYRARN